MNTNGISRTIAAGLLVGTLALATVGGARAEVLPGEDASSGDTACSESLLRFLDDHPDQHHDRKAAAIIGLDGADAVGELDSIRAAITERCR